MTGDKVTMRLYTMGLPTKAGRPLNPNGLNFNRPGDFRDGVQHRGRGMQFRCCQIVSHLSGGLCACCNFSSLRRQSRHHSTARRTQNRWCHRPCQCLNSHIFTPLKIKSFNNIGTALLALHLHLSGDFLPKVLGWIQVRHRHQLVGMYLNHGLNKTSAERRTGRDRGPRCDRDFGGATQNTRHLPQKKLLRTPPSAGVLRSRLRGKRFIRAPNELFPPANHATAITEDDAGIRMVI